MGRGSSPTALTHLRSLYHAGSEQVIADSLKQLLLLNRGRNFRLVALAPRSPRTYLFGAEYMDGAELEVHTTGTTKRCNRQWQRDREGPAITTFMIDGACKRPAINVR